MIEPGAARDADDLATFGYRQRLDRSLGGFSSFAAGFSYLSILTGLPQLFYLGYGSGGPAFFWSWPLVFAGQFLVALCFAELASRYPLSGGVYQWSKRAGSPAVGWLAGWVYLACAVITLASVAATTQVALPQITPQFQLVGSGSDPADAARNAVALGSLLLAFSTAINAFGVRLLARINDVGVIAELIGAILLVAVLWGASRRGLGVVLETLDRGEGMPWGYAGAFLAAALVPSYVMYGFDTAGSLAEETADPRRKAPRAILGALASVAAIGALLILGTLRAADSLADPELGRIGGGMPMVIKHVLGPGLGRALLCVVALAITVCTLTVHAAAVRLVFAMARDGALPFAGPLARLAERSRAPVLPAILLGLGAIGLLLLNRNQPQLVEILASVAIVWANLAYLLVTAPMLIGRLRPRNDLRPPDPPGVFSLGRWGLIVNLGAVAWGLFMIANIGWPRAAVYGEIWYRRLAAPLATSALLASGLVAYGFMRRRGSGVLEDHRAMTRPEGSQP